MEVKNVLVYGDSIVVNGIANITDSTLLSAETIALWTAVVGE